MYYSNQEPIFLFIRSAPLSRIDVMGQNDQNLVLPGETGN